jgi:hypothetical protein
LLGIAEGIVAQLSTRRKRHDHPERHPGQDQRDDPLRPARTSALAPRG